MTEKPPPNPKYPYLAGKASEIVEHPDFERIQYIRTAKWIDYTAAKQVLAELEDLITSPEDLRPQCRLIIGDSNNGKSSIIDRFLKRHRTNPNLDGDAVVITVVAITALRADEKALYDWLLAALFEPLDPKLSTPDSQKLVINQLRRLKPKLIIIDEAHELAKGVNRSVVACQSAIKAITNLTHVPIAAFGIDEVLNAFSLDGQIANRFIPVYLPRWKWGPDFRGLLVAYETILPLRKPSKLNHTVIGHEILQRTGGLLGEVRQLLTDSAIYAIKNGIEQITVKVIKDCKYRPADERRKKPK
ncbi:MAG: TniB family NTP-binding protein [Rubrivivax sp.]|nr:TniB family NTP-binding protein [Rubrivivax sp.]